MASQPVFYAAKIIPTLKIPLLGEAYVGKTTIANFLSGGGYVKDYNMTVGVDIFLRYIDLKNNTIRIQLWDLAGQRRFSFLRKIFYRGSHGAIFIFDITRARTFLMLEDWINDFIAHHPNTPFIIVGNKKDLEENRAVYPNEAMILAKKYNTEYIETSAKTGENVEKALRILLQRIARRKAVISI